MRGVVFASLLAIAGCGVDVTNVDLGPSAQDAASGGFAGSSGGSGGQSGNASTGGLSGNAGTSGSAGQAGVAGTVSDAGPDVPEDVGADAEPDAGEDAAPDGGMEPDGSSDAAGDSVSEDAPNQSTCNQAYVDQVWAVCFNQHPFTLGVTQPMGRACSTPSYSGDPTCQPKCLPTGFCSNPTIATQVCGHCMVTLHKNYPQYLNHPFVDCLDADPCF